MAADANRPTSSLVNRFSATDAASVASYLPTAATTGSADSRSAAATRSSARRPAPIPLDSPRRPSTAAASSSASTRMSMRPETTPSSTSCTEYATSSAQSITWASRHGLPSGAPDRIQSAAAASSRVEAELALLRPAPPRVLGHRVQRGPGQVQPRAAVLGAKDFGLEPGQDAEVLRVALEAAVLGGDLVEGALAVVAVRRMADVVSQAGHVDEVGIAAQPDRHAAADLRHLQRVGQPGARRLALTWPDDLRLVRQSAQGGAVQDPRPVAGEIGAVFGIGARQRSTLRRFDHQTLPVELVVGISNHSHRRTVCQYYD